MEFPIVEVVEGFSRAYVPDVSRYRVGNRMEPAHAPVFYNPDMMRNRTMSVLAIEAYRRIYDIKDLVICEPLSGTGIRGIRYAREVSGVRKVVLNDIDERAYVLIKHNIHANNLSDVVEVYNDDASALMLRLRRSIRFNVIDIDPFGSPIPFMYAALKAISSGGLICVTATDLGVLSGAHESKCIRRYGARPMRSPFSKEVGIRILVGAIARMALELNYGIVPLLSYYERHYYRVFMLVVKDSAHAKECVESLGYVYYSKSDLRRGFVHEYPVLLSNPRRDNVLVGGPLWIGRMVDLDFLSEVRKVASERVFYGDNGLKELLNVLAEESTVSSIYYTTDELCRRLGRELRASYVIDMLRELGYYSSRTHFSAKGFRAEVSPERLVNIVRMIS